jgi:hypothetical protein
MEIAVPRLIAFSTVRRMRHHRDKEVEIRAREEEHLKLLGGTQTSHKSEIVNASFSGNASGTKQSFGVDKAKVEVKVEEREKTPY